MNGVFEHSYAAGSPDAGLYIGQCFPCNAVIDDVHAEHNGLGYSGTNSGGNLLIVNSQFNNNRAGIVPNSGSYELCYPQRETTIVGNLVYSNNQPDTPAIDDAILAMGNGILISGGVRNTISRNRVWDHDVAGIALAPFPEERALDDQPSPDEWDAPCAETKDDPVNTAPPESLLWDAVRERRHRQRDRGQRDRRPRRRLDRRPGVPGQLLRRQHVRRPRRPSISRSSPPATARGRATGPPARSISGPGSPPLRVLHRASITRRPSFPSWKPLENMPDAATAPPAPATTCPRTIDVDAITVPDAPAG